MYDLVVIGAGAAGLGATRTATDLGLDVLVLEAKDRFGGRAHTDVTSLGVPWDRGAHWLHYADRNPFRDLADAWGVAYEARSIPRRVWCDAWADPASERELADYERRAFAAVLAAGEDGRDVAAAEVIPDHPRFRAMFDSWFAAIVGVEPERMSTLDYARDGDSSHNWPMVNGFGALVARYGAGLPVRLSSPVSRVHWEGPGVTVTTPIGDVSARAAIVTVSTAVLVAERIAFEPRLPQARLEAFAAVPLGEANKVAIAFDRDVFGDVAPCYLHLERPTAETIRFESGPFGRRLAVGHFGGRFAAEIEAAGARAMADFALDRLAEVFGHAIRERVRAAATTAWCSDPHVGGGYSCARPGLGHLRPLLGEPLGERLWFAGEACHLAHYGTVHGALESGIAAARAIAATLRPGEGGHPWA